MHILPQLKNNKIHNLPFSPPPPVQASHIITAWHSLLCGLCAPAPVVTSPHSPRGPALTSSLPPLHLLTLLYHKGLLTALHTPGTFLSGPLHSCKVLCPEVSCSCPNPSLLKHQLCSKSWIQSCPFLKPPSSITRHTPPSHTQQKPHEGRSWELVSFVVPSAWVRDLPQEEKACRLCSHRRLQGPVSALGS